MVRYNRALPVRVSLVVLAVVLVVFNALLSANAGHGASDDVILAVLGLIAVAIGGDTFRPSGMVRNGGGGDDTLARLAAEAKRLREMQHRRPPPANLPGGALPQGD